MPVILIRSFFVLVCLGFEYGNNNQYGGFDPMGGYGGGNYGMDGGAGGFMGGEPEVKSSEKKV